MAVPPTISFHSRPQAVAWTGAAIFVTSVVIATALLAAV